jgi:hypothetical protein
MTNTRERLTIPPPTAWPQPGLTGKLRASGDPGRGVDTVAATGQLDAEHVDGDRLTGGGEYPNARAPVTAELPSTWRAATASVCAFRRATDERGKAPTAARSIRRENGTASAWLAGVWAPASCLTVQVTTDSRFGVATVT